MLWGQIVEDRVMYFHWSPIKNTLLNARCEHFFFFKQIWVLKQNPSWNSLMSNESLYSLKCIPSHFLVYSSKLFFTLVLEMSENIFHIIWIQALVINRWKCELYYHAKVTENVAIEITLSNLSEEKKSSDLDIIYLK